MRAYAERHLVSSRLLLVVVGNVGRPAVEAAVRRSLARLPRGSYAWSLPAAPPPRPTDSARAGAASLVPRALATNYVLGVFAGPPASSRDAPAFRVATALLGARFGSAVREERGLSYAAYAPFLDRGVTAAVLYASTGNPRATLAIARAQLDTLRRLPYPAVAMRYFTDQFVTQYIGNNMTSPAQADFLARAELYGGDYRLATREMDGLRAVTGSDVKSAAARYLRRPYFVYVGDTSRVDRRAFAAF